jgi:regulator of sigma E protease
MDNQILTTLVAAAFVLGVVVLVHEFGHFIVAKWAGVYVKTFSIGFGKKILRKRWGETDYALSVLPFGGYVKFAGETELYDEEDDVPEEDRPRTIEDLGADDEVPDHLIPRERYFTTRPPAVRAAVLFAGPFFNYVLAILLYVGIFLIHGVEVAPTSRVGTVASGGPADSVGIHVGDEIVAIDGTPVEDWSGVENAFANDAEGVKEFRVRRDGNDLTIPFRARKEGSAIRIGFSPYLPAKLGRVPRGKPAYEAGMRPGAVIEAINDTVVTSYDDVRRIVNENPGRTLYFEWTQDGRAFADSITPQPTETLAPGSTSEFTVVGIIGIAPSYERKRLGLGESLVGGFREANRKIVQIVWYLKQLIMRKMGVKTLGGPILIAQMAGDVANWGFDYLLLFLAFFNINLCIFNLLPVLPFDGGHLAIIGVEAVARRPLNKRVRGWLTQGGFVLIILLMAFVVLLDLSRCAGSGPGPF